MREKFGINEKKEILRPSLFKTSSDHEGGKSVTVITGDIKAGWGRKSNMGIISDDLMGNKTERGDITNYLHYRPNKDTLGPRGVSTDVPGTHQSHLPDVGGTKAMDWGRGGQMTGSKTEGDPGKSAED